MHDRRDFTPIEIFAEGAKPHQITKKYNSFATERIQIALLFNHEQ
jgi:hypothetical protein